MGERERRHFIKHWRGAKGLSQVELAASSGITAQTISRIERGLAGYTQDALEAIAGALGETPGTLIDRAPSDFDFDLGVLPKGNNIRALRKAAGLSQEDLSIKALGYYSTRISLLEGGKVPLNMKLILKFSKALGVKPKDIIIQTPANLRTIDERTPRDEHILFHVPGFADGRQWTIGHWQEKHGSGAWYSVEKEFGLNRGEIDIDEPRVEPDGWAPLPK